MTTDDIATRYLRDARRLARAWSRDGTLREEMMDAATLGLCQAAKNAVRDGVDIQQAGAYVTRTVKLRLIDAMRRYGPRTRRGHARDRAFVGADTTDLTRDVVYARKPYDEDAHRGARVPLASGAQRAIARGTGGGRMAHLMRWLVVGLALAAAPVSADSTVTWPTRDEGGLPIPTVRTPKPGECNDNTLRKCWSAEIINGMAGNLVVDDDPQPGETHRWTPCFRKGVGYVLAVCWNDCGQGQETKMQTNCIGPAQPAGPTVTWP